MAKFVTKFKYLKSGARNSAGSYAKYIATREGVEKIDDTKKFLPPTKRQNKLIEKLLKDFSDSKNSLEYEDYMNKKTIGTAAEFISRTVEDNMDKILDKKTYADYIATRPRAEHFGSHGLFTDDGVYVDLKKVSENLNSYDGNVWTVIISLRREDAERLGFDNGKRWRDMLRSQTVALSEEFNIPLKDLKWFAAFHDEGYHPHVHLIVYSVNEKEGYLSEQSVENLRSSFAKDIFSQDMISVYEKQTELRNSVKQNAKEIVKKALESIKEGYRENAELEKKILLLSEELSRTKGKKVYSYLRSDIKDIVDEIVDELGKDNRISDLYNLWYKQKDEIYGIYTSQHSERVSLSDNAEFRSIKNAVIQEAISLSNNGNDGAPNNISPKIVSGIMNLMYYVCNLFRDKINTDHPAKIDRKERQKTNEKKQAQGLKLE